MLQQRSSQYQRLTATACSIATGNENENLTDLVRRGVREELRKLQAGGPQANVTAITDVFRDEIRPAMQPFTHPLITYAEALRAPVPVPISVRFSSPTGQTVPRFASATTPRTAT